MTVQNFPLPASASDFVTAMDVKTKALISLGVWDLTTSRYRGWSEQFVSEQEQFLAACILDNLIYRQKKQFTASLRSLIQGPLRWNLSSTIPGDSDLDLQAALKAGKPARTVIIPAIDESEPPTKSGPFVLRRLKKSLEASTSLMEWPWVAAAMVNRGEIDTVVIVDDFLGTGHQILSYLKGTFGTLDPNVRWIYATVCAHQKGLAHLAAEASNLTVFAAEIYGDEHGFFHDKYWSAVSNGFIDGAMAKAFYENFLDTKKLRSGNTVFHDHPFGYGGLALCLGFEHGTPDNSLPVLWSQDRDWLPLWER